MSATRLGELVTLISKSLVDHPDEVSVREMQVDRLHRIELHVAQEDVGKVIGREGRTAQSIRSLLQASSTKTGNRVQLDIVD